MNIKTYITGSVVLHIAFLILIGMTSVEQQSKPVIFDVNLTDPVEIQKLPDIKKPPAVATKKPPIPKEKVPLVKKKPPVPKAKKPILDLRKPPPLDESIKPDAMTGDSLGQGPKSSADSEGREGKKDRGKQKGQDAKKSEEKMVDVPAGEKGVTSSGKDTSTLAPRAFLFDKNIIEKYARKGPPSKISKSKGLSYLSSEFKNRSYMRMMKDKLKLDCWKIPEDAKKLNISLTDVRVDFVVEKDGSVGEIDLVRTSGYFILDEAVLKGLRNCKFWPLPETWEGDNFKSRWQFIYILGPVRTM